MKKSSSQQELRFQDIFNVNQFLVGGASFVHFGTENWEEQLKNQMPF